MTRRETSLGSTGCESYSTLIVVMMPVIVLMFMMLELTVMTVMMMTMIMMITLAFKPGKRCQNAPAVRDRFGRGAAGRRAPRVRPMC